MDGSFMVNENLCTDLAIIYAQSQRIMPRHSGSRAPFTWVYKLPIILSKASPSDELANLLVQKYIFIPKAYFGEHPRPDPTENFFRAVFIYLFVRFPMFIRVSLYATDSNLGMRRSIPLKSQAPARI